MQCWVFLPRLSGELWRVALCGALFTLALCALVMSGRKIRHRRCCLRIGGGAGCRDSEVLGCSSWPIHVGIQTWLLTTRHTAGRGFRILFFQLDVAGADNVSEEAADIKTWPYMPQSLCLAHISLPALVCYIPHIP